jgi:polyisoprenoid-binding protein YceI
VGEPFAVQALADSSGASDLDGALLEHAGPHSAEHVLAAAPLEHDRVDAVRVQQLREQESRGTGAHDAYLSPHLGHFPLKPPAKRVFAAVARRSRCVQCRDPIKWGASHQLKTNGTVCMDRVRRFGVLAAACAGLAFAGGASGAGANEWKVAKDQSSVQFSAVQQGSKFTGMFNDWTAEVSFDPANPGEGKIVGVVQTASVNTRDTDRDSTLPDRDWFASDEYPEARFESQSISKAADGKGYVAKGELTLKGKTKPAELDFTFDASSGMGKLHGTMAIDRLEYGVGEGYTDPSWVSQEVDVEVTLALTK